MSNDDHEYLNQSEGSSDEPETPAPKAAAEQAGEQSSEQENLTGELFEELTILGNRFVEVVQTAWNSDERKRMEADLKKGLNVLAENLEEGFQKVSENQQAKEVLEKADHVAENVGNKVRDNEAVNDITRGLVRGLQSLAGVLESWTQEIQDRDSAVDVEAKPHDSEDIPIDRGPVDRG